MHEIYRIICDWWLVVAVLLLACYGLGALAGNLAADFRKWLRGEPPKPRPYRVVIEDADGWPLRSYRLPAEAAARLVHDLERDQPA